MSIGKNDEATPTSDEAKSVASVVAAFGRGPGGDESAGKSAADAPLDGATRIVELNPDTKTMVGLAPEANAGPGGVKVRIGQKVGKYEIRAQLGAGGMGAVYLAFDPLIEREVALKVLAPDLNDCQDSLQRFLGEARAIGRLNNPHVVSIYDIDQWNGAYYLVMELLTGGSVASKVDNGAKLPWREGCRLIAEAARGLSAAHDAGMIHRDIKPENLMLSKENSVKVVDFGLSKLLDAANDVHKAVTKQGQILGTPQYMSPEQFESAEVDARTDIYSLGATLFRLITGRFPYHGCKTIVQVMSSHLNKPVPVATAVEPGLPKECDAIIGRAMAKRPADRYQSAAELAAALETLLHGPAVAPAKAAPQGDRPLRSVVVVEPSKLQAAVLKNACAAAGAANAQLMGDAAAARATLGSEPPDLLVTAMQLPDGRGLDLLQDLCRQGRFQQSAVVLNSSDSTLEELAAAGSAACLALAPKKVRPEEILRVVHAVGPVVAAGGPLSVPIDPTALRLQVVLESGRIPDLMADLIRTLKLLDVEVSVGGGPLVPTDPPPDLILALRRTEPPEGPPVGYASCVRLTDDAGPMTAAVQIDQGRLTLRAVRRNGVVAICQRPFDAPRLVALLQAARP